MSMQFGGWPGGQLYIRRDIPVPVYYHLILFLRDTLDLINYLCFDNSSNIK
jgi:hypothetical protein